MFNVHQQHVALLGLSGGGSMWHQNCQGEQQLASLRTAIMPCLCISIIFISILGGVMLLQYCCSDKNPFQ